MPAEQGAEQTEDFSELKRLVEGLLAAHSIYPIFTSETHVSRIFYNVSGAGFCYRNVMLTAAHVLDKPTSVEFFQVPHPWRWMSLRPEIRRQTTAALVRGRTDAKHDVCVVSAGNAIHGPALKLSGTALKRGDHVAAVGFPFGSDKERWGAATPRDGLGTAVHVEKAAEALIRVGCIHAVMKCGTWIHSTDETTQLKEWTHCDETSFVMGGHSAPGMSGGPVLNMDGELVGVTLIQTFTPDGGEITVCAGLRTLKRLVAPPKRWRRLVRAGDVALEGRTPPRKWLELRDRWEAGRNRGGLNTQ